MSTTPQDVRRKVIVAPTVGDRTAIDVLRIIPIWIGSTVIHLALLAGLFFLLNSLGNAEPPPVVEVATTTQVEEPPREPDLTNVDIGIDTRSPTNFDSDRVLQEVSVPGLANMDAPIGIHNAPEASPQTVPAPPGAGGGTGLAMTMPDAGTGALFGTPGGVGGLYNLGAFNGRSGATRERMVHEGGGNELSEAAVARGLEWLALHQAQDGRWGLHDFNRHAREKPLPAGRTAACNCTGTTSRHNDVAATGLALLPFLAAGQTHKPLTDRGGQKDYSRTVLAGLHFLMGKQGRDGNFAGDMYAHGIATIALCEAYGMTSDPLLKQSAQRALNYIVSAQDPAGGGWRYSPRTPGDTSVTGWELMALKSGQMAGLSVPRATLTKCEQFLNSVESGSKGGYAYQPDHPETYTMTAVGLLCRQYLGVSPRNEGLQKGVARLKQHPPGSGNLYYEYYATQVMHHLGGDSWTFWNLGPGGTGKGGIRDTLIARQDPGTGKTRHQKGSWEPAAAGCREGGRIMSTSLSLLCLEVYYRHLPLYRRDLGVVKDK